MQGHKKMIVWGNIEKIEEYLYKEIMPRVPKNCFSLRDQIERAVTSVSANFVEGYYSGSIKEYIRFLGFSRRSLAELNNWSRHVYLKKYIAKDVFDHFEGLTIKTLYLFNRLIYALKRKCQP
jgi:four helix bundle protein